MKFSARQYAQALRQALEGTQDTDKVLDNFVQVLAENNDMRMFEEIASEFHKSELESKGIKQVEVTSAHPLSNENEKHVIETLNRYVKGKVELKKKVDESLVGGVVIEIDDKVIDASIKNNLEKLKKDLSV